MAGIKGLFFDQDGVIIDTERDGHRVAFNEAFKEAGISVVWDVETYHELLRVAGGKERMTHYFDSRDWNGVPAGDRDELVRGLHKRKTQLFIELIESGKLPVRPGVHRLMTEAKSSGRIVAVCTTSNEKAAHAVTQTILHDIEFDVVLAGDVVSRKKPDPEIYLLALERTGLRPDEVIVVEDSYNGVTAAKAAGLRVLATVNPYTASEDLGAADVVVTSLGDYTGEPARLIRSARPFAFSEAITLGDIVSHFGG